MPLEVPTNPGRQKFTMKGPVVDGGLVVASTPSILALHVEKVKLNEKNSPPFGQFGTKFSGLKLKTDVVIQLNQPHKPLSIT